MGSSLLKRTAPIAGVKTVSIPGAHASHARTWIASARGAEAIGAVECALILIGGNSISDGKRPEVVAREVAALVRLLRGVSPRGPDLRVAICTLPPRPQIDNREGARGEGRAVFNRIIREQRGGGLDSFEVVDLDKVFRKKKSSGNTERADYDPTLLDGSSGELKAFGGIVHPSKEGGTRMSRLASDFFKRHSPAEKRRTPAIEVVKKSTL